MAPTLISCPTRYTRSSAARLACKTYSLLILCCPNCDRHFQYRDPIKYAQYYSIVRQYSDRYLWGRQHTLVHHSCLMSRLLLSCTTNIHMIVSCLVCSSSLCSYTILHVISRNCVIVLFTDKEYQRT